MKNVHSFHIVSLLVLIGLSLTLNAAPLGTQFTYQGELKIIPNGDDIIIPANAEFDFSFELYDALNRGVQVGPTVLVDDVSVDQGVFTVQLDFGMSPFSGEQLYLAIAVRDGDNTGSFTNLAPRQTLTATPYALHAEYVAVGTVGSVEINPAEVQLRVVGVCVPGTVMTAINQDGTVTCENDKDEQQLSLNGSSLSITDGNAVDLTSIDSDDQTLSLNARELSISEGNSVSLASFVNDDDNELNTELALTETTLNITDAGGTLSTDLASIDTDDQTLALTDSELSISEGNAIDLSAFVNNDDNELNTELNLTDTTLNITDAGGTLSADLTSIDTDDQTLSLNTNQLSISDGNSVDLSSYTNNDTNELNTNVTLMGSSLEITDAGGTLSADLSGLDTDDQTLSLNTNQLSISDGNSVNLSSFVNNDTNELQDLSLNTNTLQISGSASSVDLSTYLDNTDAQTLSLVNNDLNISGGNAVSLAGLFNDNDATNELNTGLTFNNTTLTVTDAGGDMTVDLSSLSDTAAEVLTKVITVDGAGSGLDADLLDGLHASDIIAAAGGNDNRTPISSIPFTINQTGSYYLTDNLTNTTTNSDGIIITADNVTLDLGGFTLNGFDNTDPINPVQTGDDGISVSGRHFNIHIYNGHIEGWAGDGINALAASDSIFERLTVSNNGGDGLVADFNAVISHVTASFNGLDGIEGDDGTVIVFSTARGNGDNGIQTSEGSHVSHSTAFDNETDGIDVADGSTVTNSVATDNGIFGFDVALGGTVQMSTAYNNGGNGFDVASASIIRNNISSLNGGWENGSDNPEETQWSGFRTFANSWIINNKAHENDGAGIRISSTDCLVEGNSITDNDNGGLVVTASGNLIINNKASGNIINNDPDTMLPRNAHFEIDDNSSWGPIVDVTGAGDISTVTNADHPFANFIY